MKIALFHDLPSGGAKRTVYEIVKRLVARGHQLDAYTLTSADHQFADLRTVVRKYEQFGFEPHKLFRRPLGRLNDLQRWRDLRRLERLGSQVAKTIDAGHYDVVFVHPSQWTQGPTILQYLRTPAVYYVQEPLRRIYEPDIARPYNSKSSWKTYADQVNPLKHLYERKLIDIDRRNTHAADQLLANSKFTANNVAAIYGRQAEVSYLGIDPQAFYPLPHTKKRNFVLSVGQVKPLKGYDFLIQALALLPASIRPELRVVGNSVDDQESSYLTALARACHVSLLIEKLVSDSELVARYNEAMMVVYAPIREPFGLVPLEAMACGTPVVGVAEGGVCETVVDGLNGRLAPRDPAQFAAAVRTLFEDETLRRRFGCQARAHVLAHWTWERSVEQIEQKLYRTAKTQS